MDQNSILGSIDPELMETVLSRRDALRGFGKFGAGLAYASVPVALGVLSKTAVAQSSGLPQQIVDVLNFALTLEELEAEFYRRGLATSALIPARFRPVFESISEHENAHVALLRGVLGAQAVAKPTFDFTAGGMYFNVFTAFGTYVALSQAFEDTGVGAYKGQAGNLMSNKDILTTALQIHSVEARHAGEVRMMRGKTPWIVGRDTDIGGAEAVYQNEGVVMQFGVDVPAVSTKSATAVDEAFDEPLTREQVLAIVSPFIK